MSEHAEKLQENRTNTSANDHTFVSARTESSLEFIDNRPEAVAQQKLQEIANHSPQAKRTAQLIAEANSHSDLPIQKQEIEKEELLQGKFETVQKMDLEEKLLQGKFETARQSQPIQKQENSTGLPDNLKGGVENLSGYSMDDVRVHYNSPKPAQLHAHAYAQGTSIHLTQGQERHLPHEAWHVVQQMQSRVRPTEQMNGHVNINDDNHLEREADVMGVKALNLGRSFNGQKKSSPISTDSTSAQRSVIQRAVGMEFECTALDITEEPTGAKKGDIIKEDHSKHWQMTYEETAAGTPVVEFIVQPAAETGKELKKAVTGIAKAAKKLDKENPVPIGPYTIKKSGPICGAIQVTFGVPLADIPKFYTQYNTGLGKSKGFERYKALLGNEETEDTEFEKAPDGTEVRSLPDSTKGLLVLLMDYIVRGYVPEDKTGSISFAKGLYPIMARTDFASMFKTLPDTEKNRISYISKSKKGRIMKRVWWKWIIKKSLADDSLSKKSLREGTMINQELLNWNGTHVGKKRKDFLQQLPQKDLMSEDYMGLGALGNKADFSSTDPAKFAPIFEMRKPYGSSAPYSTWTAKSKDTWQKYNRIVSERFNLGGKIN